MLTNKWIKVGNYFVFGGAFVSPFLFVLSDIIAEIFTSAIARTIVIFSFVCQTIVAIIIKIIMGTPAPESWIHQQDFSYVLGSLLWIDLSGCFAYFFSSFVNIHFITKWQAIVMGKFFWLRSIGSSFIAEALHSAFAIIMISFGSLPYSAMLQIISITFLIKVFYSAVLAYPGDILVRSLKLKLNLDPYQFNSKSNRPIVLIRQEIEKLAS